MRFISFLIAILTGLCLQAQITTNPAVPIATQALTITFNSAQESRLGYFTGDLYAHTGVTIEGKGQWKNVIGNWGQNTIQPKLTNKGNGIYELSITPDINSFYNVSSGDRVTEICLVFRSADGTKQTNDLFISVYEDGLNIHFTSPSGNLVVLPGETVSISALSTQSASLKLRIDNTEIATQTGTEISGTYQFNNTGLFWLIAEANDNSLSSLDSIKVEVIDFNAAKPETYRKGINYTSETSAALVLWAPNKKYVHAIGDFNNWEASAESLMKKDGDYFWIEINNLEKGKEYAYQYLIDGEIRIADPYTEKILDPWNDQYIPASVYPNLKAYPSGKTEGIVSVLQTGQEKYQWQVDNFQVPSKEKLIIYELLVRDFTAEHTYSAVIDKLDYLKELNINVLELMPINEFEGNNSWGYNPAFYFAPDKYYGTKNELKRLIDECHKRGIAVVIDMVLNHSYGQSPFVQMYMDNWTILPENPWYNVESPNPVYSWGYDFNHESAATQELVDSINSFWINEYKVDGFRFDFTKGFTNTPGDGSAYDQSRINILKRMADEIWNRKSDALVIFEHLASNTEEKILAEHDILLWGNRNYQYGQTAMGYNANLYDVVAENKGWNVPHLVTYMESHDEERITYKCRNYGQSNGNYNTRELPTALKRLELNSVFFIPLPGPKMIWQFGELGYDYSINYCTDGTIQDACRTSEKPIRWDYLQDSNRKHLHDVTAQLNQLKQNYDVFSPDNTEYSLTNMVKWYKLSKNNQHVIAIGNFDIQAQNLNFTFPKTGKWYEFFSGDSIQISNVNYSFSLAPGEYRLYSTQKFETSTVVTDVKEISVSQSELRVYPNPANQQVNVEAELNLESISLFSSTGTLLYHINTPRTNRIEINVSGFSPGIYFIRTTQGNSITTQKLIIK